MPTEETATGETTNGKPSNNRVWIAVALLVIVILIFILKKTSSRGHADDCSESNEDESDTSSVMDQTNRADDQEQYLLLDEIKGFMMRQKQYIADK